jgi:hypothetical protein
MISSYYLIKETHCIIFVFVIYLSSIYFQYFHEAIKSLLLNFNLCLSVKKDRLSCSFISIPVLSITDVFIISTHTLMVNTKKAVVIAGATIYNFNHEIRNNESDLKTF